jgi:heme-degrading monooxygenase HmoA
MSAGPAGRARVLIFYRAPSDDPEVVEKSYHAVSQVLDATPGLLSNELLREVTDQAGYVVLSEWESLAAFQEWETGTSHRGNTSPMRSYQDRENHTKHYGIYEVVASYQS